MKKQAAKRKGNIPTWHTIATRKPRSYSVSDEVHDAIKTLAKQRDVSISMLVESALKQFLDSERGEANS